ncbi:nSTAND1 domain-containing NTPase [Symbioplanes lichenis]|uniref:nSTAND1 domain-containing NTPase n=1 Tax=Symbioplanes lichenis TaxID=1629072 RepID=UPI002738CDF1|nr:helix-turn-helix domain-containing protein [Actinoplanes lichenis]
MPRPERALDPAAGPAQRLAAELRDLRRAAGTIGYRHLAARAGYSAATLAGAAGGRSLPSLPVTLAFVRACGGDPAAWEHRWREASAAQAAMRGGGPWQAPVQRPPWPGPAGYGVDDTDRFLGRRRMLAHVLETLGQHRVVAVHGASGSGKSSLLRAGLIPAWRRRGSPASLITPGAGAARALRAALERASDAGLLVVDQFEEFFDGPPGGCAFLADLTTAAERADPRLRVVIGVRTDFFVRCTDHPAPVRLLADAAGVPVGPPAADELREIVAEPARRAGLSVERALTTRIAADADGQPGALPLLGTALLAAWQHRRGDILTLSGYEAAGGMRRVITDAAESVHRDSSERGRETARQVLVRLVTFGDGVPDTRRLVRPAEWAGLDAGPVLAELARARVIVLGAGTAELAHEGLIRAWPRLAAWLHTGRAELRLHRRLTEAAEIWRSYGRDSGALYRGAPLADWDGRGLRQLNTQEREFLTASRRQRTADRPGARRRRSSQVVYRVRGC